MAKEKKLQTEIIEWLRANGVYVIKTQPGMGTPVGCLDIVGLYREKHTEIEVKAAENSKSQPGQVLTFNRLKEHNPWVFRVWPENWPEVKKHLQMNFF